MEEKKEYFDIYDEQLNLLGQASRQKVHAEGLWHQTFHCWIVSEVDGKPHLLFQLRHANKDTYPSLLDISCAGHLQAGESVKQGSRELEEELGLSVPFEQLIPCGIYRVQNHIKPGLIDREICHVFGMVSNQALAAYQMQEDEVTGLYWISVQDIVRLFCELDTKQPVWAAGVSLAPDGSLKEAQHCFSSQDFVPHAPEYYKLVLAGLGLPI
ncbi:NUDIX hydrolase [Paenibacillus agricola]|uniref:NUDIX domain-containing protein n=1 Tax=Paenibacillus agricola TaxID=2716264 RepID=A0ABX0J407_9BACL|nr:NUDIX domain-containing protein [Paenibacillus agricola]NHN30561.1 NUDIX domain-containing protein [Paenibacillus agricola]